MSLALASKPVGLRPRDWENRLHTLISTDLSEWAAHRHAVVLAVSRQVPGTNPEVATSQGLARLCREIVMHGAVDSPVKFWHRAAVEAAIASVAPTAELAAAPRRAPAPSTAASESDRPTPDHPTAQDASRDDAVPAPLPPSIPPAGRAIDFEHLNSAMDRLSAQDRQLLWDRHVHNRPVEQIAQDAGVLPYAARRRLRRAENVLAAGFAETHAGASDRDECQITRGAMHDYIRHRLLPGRRQDLEDHLVECPECTRAFVDVRESYWMLRAAAPVLLLGTVSVPGATTVATTATGMAAGGGAASAGAAAGGATTGAAVGTALGNAEMVAHSGATVLTSLLGKSTAVLGKSAVLVRTLTFDPATLAAVIAGTLLATGAAAGVAVRSDVGPFSVSSPVRVPLTEEDGNPAREASEPSAASVDRESEGDSSSEAVPGGLPLALPSALPSPSDTQSVDADGDGLGSGPGPGDAVGVEAGADVEVGEERTEVTVEIAAEGKLLYSLYEITPGDRSEVLEIALNRDFGLVTKLNGTYYVIPALASLTAADIRAQVTLIGPEGASADISAVTEKSARREGFAGLTELVGELSTQLDAASGDTTDVGSQTLSELVLTTDGTLRTTQGTLDDLHGALDEALDALLNR